MLNYEHKRKPLLSTNQFYRRIANNILIALIIMICSIAIGIAGYMGLAHLGFTDALLNSSMILGGMGPVDPMPSDAAKYFASFYALFSGISFLSTVALLLAPAVHRALHRFHLETEEDENKNDRRKN